MAEEPDTTTPAEAYLARRRAERDRDERGPRLSRRQLQSARSVEGYLTASSPPRWMERVTEVDRGIARERRRLDAARRALADECAGDDRAFAGRWRALVEAWAFDEELNELIRRHNEWFPIERGLAVDPRTRDYVLVNGRSYRRPVLDARWALHEFPA